jgi:ubiquinone/menaquinone biosynthesis C-methylase UbiE
VALEGWMPAFVLMKVFEAVPARYDSAMDFLTLGRVGRLKREIACAVAGKGQRILDLGCGAGSLAVMMAERGARVVAIDRSEPMLDIARRRAQAADLEDRITVRRLSVMEIDSFPAGSFDGVVSTLVLSELSDHEIEFVLSEARRLLAPGGRLAIGEETVPERKIRDLGFRLLRYPIQLIAYLAAQAQSISGGWARRALYFAVELPLMLLVFFLVPPPSRPLRDLEARLRHAGFVPAMVRDYLGGALRLIQAVAT